MLRRSLRRQYRLVRVEVHDRHLNVITGAVWQRALETLRRLAFALTGGSLSVSRGGGAGAMAREQDPLLTRRADGVPAVRCRRREDQPADWHVPALHLALPPGAGARLQRAAGARARRLRAVGQTGRR